MAAGKIEKYVAAWHPDKNRGAIVVYLKGGEKKTWGGQTAAEFLAILRILDEGDSLLTNKGWISTGKQVPGGIEDTDV